MNKFHFAIGIHAIATLLLLAVLLALPLVTLAQDTSETAPASEVALFAIPPVLLGLMALNNRSTEGVKLYLSSDKLPFTPPASVRSLIVLVFSAGFGIVSAFMTPTATDWLGATFNPFAAVVVTGFVVSLGAGAFQMVMSLVSSLGNQSVYKTSTTISTPPSDVSPIVAKDTLEVASQAVQKG